MGIKQTRKQMAEATANGDLPDSALLVLNQMAELLDRAACKLQDQTDSDMNDPLAMEISSFLET